MTFLIPTKGKAIIQAMTLNLSRIRDSDANAQPRRNQTKGETGAKSQGTSSKDSNWIRISKSTRWGWISCSSYIPEPVNAHVFTARTPALSSRLIEADRVWARLRETHCFQALCYIIFDFFRIQNLIALFLSQSSSLSLTHLTSLDLTTQDCWCLDVPAGSIMDRGKGRPAAY